MANEQRRGPEQRQPRAAGYPNRDRRDEPPSATAELKRLLATVSLQAPNADLFDKTAQGAAREVAANRRRNKPTQIRKFFDEVCMWEAKVTQTPDRFADYLPFIRMMNAKVAYAEGRELVDVNFRELFRHCIDSVADLATMRNAKLFLEAFLGFYKVERPKD